MAVESGVGRTGVHEEEPARGSVSVKEREKEQGTFGEWLDEWGSCRIFGGRLGHVAWAWCFTRGRSASTWGPKIHLRAGGSCSAYQAGRYTCERQRIRSRCLKNSR